MPVLFNDFWDASEASLRAASYGLEQHGENAHVQTYTCAQQVRASARILTTRCFLYHISAPNWQLATSSLLDGPKPMYCGNWPVARLLGGYFRIVHFFISLFACLFYLSAGTHYDRL